jgi:hypothetical protein
MAESAGRLTSGLTCQYLAHQMPAPARRNPAHENAVNGKQYGFPYDDDAGRSSDISVANPHYMVIAVGW